jgi:hypothetical protein
MQSSESGEIAIRANPFAPGFDCKGSEIGVRDEIASDSTVDAQTLENLPTEGNRVSHCCTEGALLDFLHGQTLTHRICRRPLPPDIPWRQARVYLRGRGGSAALLGCAGGGGGSVQVDLPRLLSDDELLPPRGGDRRGKSLPGDAALAPLARMPVVAIGTSCTREWGRTFCAVCAGRSI